MEQVCQTCQNFETPALIFFSKTPLGKDRQICPLPPYRFKLRVCFTNLNAVRTYHVKLFVVVIAKWAIRSVADIVATLIVVLK